MPANQETELRNLLQPYVRTFSERKYDVEDEDVESLISFASAFGVLDNVLREVNRHSGKGDEERPNAFWEFLKLIPNGAPPGQEEILTDEED